MPCGSRVVKAWAAHSGRTGQLAQMVLASLSRHRRIRRGV
jgi:hypothetical protein